MMSTKIEFKKYKILAVEQNQRNYSNFGEDIFLYFKESFQIILIVKMAYCKLGVIKLKWLAADS